MLNVRDYQPSLLWAKAVAWYEAQPTELIHLRPLGPHDLALYVYRLDKPGAYYFHGPKMYWTDAPMSGSHFGNCDQDDLAESAGQLGEVVLYDRRIHKTILIGRTFAEALKRLERPFDVWAYDSRI